jgi:predicted RNA methylase
MVDFISRLEDEMQAVELTFPPTPGFGIYNKFLEHAMTHPAKMNVALLQFLIEQYTKVGDTILDPMAGTGSMGVVAALRGRNAIQVELEGRFFSWMELAKKKVERTRTLTKKGAIQNIQGDARKLPELIASAVISSPPYGNTINEGQEGPLVGSNEARYGRRNKKTTKSYTYTSDGKRVDAAITSPPYVYLPPPLRAAWTRPMFQVLTANEKKNTSSNLRREERLLLGGHRIESLMGGKARVCATESGMRYSYNPENIGNLKIETYWEAMQKVYGEIYRVLKDGGLAIIIIKPYIRNFKVIDLPWTTWLILKGIGFSLEKVYKLRLKATSFWRILYAMRHPQVFRLSHEYVIVCRKLEAAKV